MKTTCNALNHNIARGSVPARARETTARTWRGPAVAGGLHVGRETDYREYPRPKHRHESTTSVQARRPGGTDRSRDRPRTCARDRRRIWRLRMPELQAGCAGREAPAGEIC